MRLAILWCWCGLLAGCNGFALSRSAAAPRTAPLPVVMVGKNGVSRREVLGGGTDGLYKRFVKGGGGELTLFVIAGAIASYRGTKRGALFDELAALDGSDKNRGSGQHVPTVQISSSPQMGQVSVEVSAPANAPDRVDYVRGPNARTHHIRGPDACPGLLNRCGSRTPPLVRSSPGESIPRTNPLC